MSKRSIIHIIDRRLSKSSSPLRHLIVGWALQGIHVLTPPEVIFRMIIELLLWALVIILFPDFNSFRGLSRYIISFLLIHSLFWFLADSFWSYMFESFKFLKNPGIEKAVYYIKALHSLMLNANCCDAILIYGSFCRFQFHERSDLDIRILWRRESMKRIFCLPLILYFRAKASFMRMPVDIQLISNLEILKKQMRSDEIPIIIYARYNLPLIQRLMSIDEIEKNQKLFIKK